jgi:hypothetical protein
MLENVASHRFNWRAEDFSPAPRLQAGPIQLTVLHAHAVAASGRCSLRVASNFDP